MNPDRYCFPHTKEKVLTRVGAFFHAFKWCPFCPGMLYRAYCVGDKRQKLLRNVP
jgi:hypothetical protein